MRTVYVNDQTKEFDEIPEEIIMFDRLYLKGVPYERDDEAVDKEYVDTVFKNVTIKNLINRLQPKNFPSFNADLINREKENNFILKKVVRPDKYHKVKVDDAGRVVGGKTGKFTWEDKDVSTIHWSKFIWKRPHDITDYLPDLDTSKYLMRSRDNVISKKLDINTPNPGTGETVLNHDQVMRVSEDYFVGRIGGLKRDGLDTIEIKVNSLDSYQDYNGNPSIEQRIFTRGISNQVRGRNYRHIPLVSGFEVDRRISHPHGLVLNGYLYIFVLTDELSKKPNPSYRIKLTSDGKLPSKIVREPCPLPKIPLELVSGSWYERGFYVYGNRVLFEVSTGHPKHWHIASAPFNSSWKFDVNGPMDVQHIYNRRDLYINEGYFYNLVGEKGGMAVRVLDNDTFKLRTIMGGIPYSLALDGFGTPQTEHRMFNVGPYIYGFYGMRLRVGGRTIGSYKNNVISRLSTVDGRPFGIWSPVNLKLDIPEGYSKHITTSDRVTLLTMGGYEDRDRFKLVKITELPFNPKTAEMTGDVYYREPFLRQITDKFTLTSSKSSLFLISYGGIEEIEFSGSTSDYRDKVGFHPSTL